MQEGVFLSFQRFKGDSRDFTEFPLVLETVLRGFSEVFYRVSRDLEAFQRGFRNVERILRRQWMSWNELRLSIMLGCLTVVYSGKNVELFPCSLPTNQSSGIGKFNRTQFFLFCLIHTHSVGLYVCFCQGSEVSAGSAFTSPPLCSSLRLLPPEKLPCHLVLLLLLFILYSVWVCLFFLPLLLQTLRLCLC